MSGLPQNPKLKVVSALLVLFSLLGLIGCGGRGGGSGNDPSEPNPSVPVVASIQFGQPISSVDGDGTVDGTLFPRNFGKINVFVDSTNPTGHMNVWLQVNVTNSAVSHYDWEIVDWQNQESCGSLSSYDEEIDVDEDLGFYKVRSYGNKVRYDSTMNSLLIPSHTEQIKVTAWDVDGHFATAYFTLYLNNRQSVYVALGDSNTSGFADTVEYWGLIGNWFPSFAVYEEGFPGQNASNLWDSFEMSLSNHHDASKDNWLSIFTGINDSYQLPSPSMSNSCNYVEMIGKKAQAMGFKIILIPYYNWSSVYAEHYSPYQYERYKELAKVHGWLICDFPARVNDPSSGEMDQIYWRDPSPDPVDRHMNDDAHVILARLLADIFNAEFYTNAVKHAAYPPEFDWTPDHDVFPTFNASTRLWESDFDITEQAIGSANIYSVPSDYSSIGNAIDQINTDGVSDARIIVAEGTYNNGFLNKSTSASIEIIGLGGPVITAADAVQVAKITAPYVYIDGIIFDGLGTSSACFEYHCPNAFDRGYFNNCVFRNSGSGNGFQSRGQGEVYLVGCTANSNDLDGFNYHDYTVSASAHAVEIDCCGINNGYTGTANNGSTMHENGRIIRINGTYTNNMKNVHDINSSKSLNYSCIMKVSHGPSNASINMATSHTAETWLFDCDISGGAVYDLFVDDNSIAHSSEPVLNKIIIGEFNTFVAHGD